jgi:hypothetical protein
MAICDDILIARVDGVVHCGLLSQSSPSIPELAREFDLRDAIECYREIDATAARRLIQSILHRDLAYCAEIMSLDRAGELTEQFLNQFGTENVRFWTNGTFHELRESGAAWNPVTAATFDTGVLVIGPHCSGCFWVEDED